MVDDDLPPVREEVLAAVTAALANREPEARGPKSDTDPAPAR
jgi:hypothetical protein